MFSHGKRFKDTNYFITENGDVYRNGKKLKPYLGKKGYYQISLSNNNVRQTIRVHRLVAETYIPNPDNLPQVDHKDTNKLNNHYTNLEWVTNNENMLRAVNNQLFPNGEHKKTSVLSETDVIWIREKYISGHPSFGLRAMSRKYNVSSATIGKIIHYRTWKHIP